MAHTVARAMLLARTGLSHSAAFDRQVAIRWTFIGSVQAHAWTDRGRNRPPKFKGRVQPAQTSARRRGTLSRQ
jgi:hypothetical protein